MAVRVLVADDNEIMREGLSDLLKMSEDIEVVGVAEDGQTAIERVNELLPDVVIMDIEMPKLNGIEATRQMMERHPDLKILALSAHSEDNIVAQMIKAGAKGYVHKRSAFSVLKEGIKAMIKDQTFLCSNITKVVSSNYINVAMNPNTAESDGLSKRQLEVLQMIAKGYSAKEIAEILKISPKTVNNHRDCLMKKLNIHNIPELTKYAIQLGLTTV
ncbi:MAG: response regulator transcription factor [Phycisphaerales bacterium]